MLKETPRSLRLYFAFIAIYSIYVVGATLYKEGPSAFASWSMLLDVAFAVALTYIAVRFEQLLPQPKLIKIFLIASLVLSLGSFALWPQGVTPDQAIAGIVLSVLIFIYLMKSVTRLSKEVASPARRFAER